MLSSSHFHHTDDYEGYFHLLFLSFVVAVVIIITALQPLAFCRPHFYTLAVKLSYQMAFYQHGEDLSGAGSHFLDLWPLCPHKHNTAALVSSWPIYHQHRSLWFPPC